MSIWSDIEDRSSGEKVRKEDIHKASLLIKKVGGAEKLSGFYTKEDVLLKLNHEQQQSLRWHNCDLALVDERFKRRAWYRLGVLSPLGDTGETIVQNAIDKVEKEYGFFDGYTCDEEKKDMHKYVSEKNKKMIDEIRGILDRHGMELLGWRNLIRYRRAVSAELIQDLYYDSDSPDGKGMRVLRAYGNNKEKEIGLYKVTYNRVRKENNEEIVLATSTDKRFYAPIGSDVVAIWQKVNDEHVRVNGEWNLFLSPKGTPYGEADVVYSDIPRDLQEKNFLKIKTDYYYTLYEKYGCKIGEIEDEKLSVDYWDAFTGFMNQKDMDSIKIGDIYLYSYTFHVGIDDYYYRCDNYPGFKTPTNHITVSIVLDDVESDNNLARVDFIEEKHKTQIEALQCTKVEWRKEKSFSFIDVILDADFRDKLDWQRQFEWMYNTLIGLHKILQPHYVTIRDIQNLKIDIQNNNLEKEVKEDDIHKVPDCCKKEEPTKEPTSTTIAQPHMGQVLIIFENILNGDSLLDSKEIQTLCNHQFGECNLTIGKIDQAEELHDWLDKEMHKAVNGNYDQIYKIKAPFADIQGEDESGEYSGPVYVHLFEPDAATDDGILLFTCNWKGSIFSNNLYVIGVIADEDDIDRIISSKIKRDVPEENLKAAGVPSKQEIERIIGSGARYTVQADGTIDVEWAAFGELRIEKKDCKDGRLPLRFGKVDINFNCSNCGLTTLEGAPQYVREDFKCNNNKLTSLVGGPKEVKESYYCQDNQLTSLVGAPRKVGNITKDTYTSFDTGESWVTGYSSYCVFDCQNNKITSLEGVDMHLMGTMKCAGNCISKKKKFNIVVEAGTVRWGKQNLE